METMQQLAPEQLTITRAGEDHVEELAALYSEAAKKWGIGGGDKPLWNCSEDYTRGLMERGEVYIGLVAGEIATAAIVSWEDTRCWGTQPPDAAYVHRLATHPSYAGLGLGARMLDYTAELALQNNRRLLRLDCSENLKEYYKEQGFEDLGSPFTSLRSGYVGHQHERQLT
jgi:protein-tyrosine phosphatase